MAVTYGASVYGTGTYGVIDLLTPNVESLKLIISVQQFEGLVVSEDMAGLLVVDSNPPE